MVMRVESSLSSAIKETLEDLAPFPGRAATTWRVALVCAIVSGIAMMFHIPESALSVYLVIFLMKADGAENTIVSAAAFIAITILVALMIPILQSTIESTFIRLLVMIVVSYVFIFLGAASKLGEGGSIVALIIAFILSMVSAVPINGVISLALRFAWEMAILPLFVIGIFSLFFGRWSVELLREQLRERLQLAHDLFTETNVKTSKKLEAFLAEGNADAEKKSMFTKVLHQVSKKNIKQINADIPASYQLVYCAASLAEKATPEERLTYAQAIDDIVVALDKGAPLHSTLSPDATPSKQARIFRQAIETISGSYKQNFTKSDNESFFATDAFSNPIYERFALKTTLAAIACYLLYSAIDWNGIHTAMVTCYVASLGTAGDTVHKLVLRISGCLVGAFIGVISILYILPHLGSLGGLMLLVFAATYLAAWVGAGSEKISYAGVQIGLAFTLTVLQGFGPTTDLDSARDRIIGILVGNVAVYLASVFIWPQPVSTTAQTSLVAATRSLADLASTTPDQRQSHIATIAEIEKRLGDLRYCYYLQPFEPQMLRASTEIMQTGLLYSEHLSQLARAVYFSDEPMPEVAGRLRRLANHIQNYNLLERTYVPPAEPIGFSPDKQVSAQIDNLEILITGSHL